MVFTNISSLNSSANTMLNKTQDQPISWKPSENLKTSLYLLYVVVGSIGVAGNIVVCYILGFKQKCKRHFDVLLISLAIADLMALISGTMTMIGDLMGDLKRWYFGGLMCKLLPSMSPITLFASSWTLAVISYDRFRVVRQKYSKDLEKRVIAIQLTFVWAAALVVTSPYIAGSNYHNQKCYTEAIWSAEKWVAYIGFWITIGWGIPLIVIICFCYMILRRLNRAIQGGTHMSMQRRRIKRNRDILKLFIIMVCAFFLLTTPYAAFYFSATYFMYLQPKTVNLKVAQQLNYALFVLMMTNSSINPIIYAKLHKEINKSAVRTWKRLRQIIARVCRCFSKPNTETMSISAAHGSSASGDNAS